MKINSKKSYENKKKKKGKHVDTQFDRINFNIRDEPMKLYEGYKNILAFERKMININLLHCPTCHGLSLNPKMKNDGTCDDCSQEQKYHSRHKKGKLAFQDMKRFYLDNEMLPVWYETDDSNRQNPHYELPDELIGLSFAEQMLIQKLSVYIPVFHLKNGNTAIRGHCCCFIQDITSVCRDLPRKTLDIVKVIRYQKRDDSTQITNLKVRRKKVLDALYWLKEHNKYYKDININQENLDWMDNEQECELNASIINEIKIDIDNKEGSKNNEQEKVENTVSENQTETTNNDISIEVTQQRESVPFSSTKAHELVDELNEELNKKDFGISPLKFPTVNEDAISEYGNDILPMIFPWLYPGGIGGSCNSIINQDMTRYGRRMLNYADGRFKSDYTWSYYYSDMVQRKKNNQSGNWLMKDGFIGQKNETVESLREKIKNNDINFIDMLRNYSKRIRGSDNYWRSKKKELETWIEFHVEHGNGIPTLFLTLSCSENWWPDLLRLFQLFTKF